MNLRCVIVDDSPEYLRVARTVLERGGIDEMAGLFVRLNERFDRSTQPVVAVAGTFQVWRALIRHQRDRAVEKVL